jgi:hypothetical protein
MLLIGATAVNPDGTWSMVLRDTANTQLIAIVKDDSGKYNCDIFDRVSQKITFHYIEDAECLSEIEIMHERKSTDFSDVAKFNSTLLIENKIPDAVSIDISDRNLVDFKNGFLFAVPSFIAVYITRRYLVKLIPDIITEYPFIITKNAFLMVFFAIIMILAAFSMLKKKKTEIIENKETSVIILIIQTFIIGIICFKK